MFRNCTWDERYQAGPEALPWDEGIPAQELIEYFAGLSSCPKRVLEIGCGTGTNAIWMAQQGASVTANDISPKAIEVAKKKGEEAGVSVSFSVSDIMEALPVPAGSIDFVFDRGVYHCMAAEQREIFIDRVAASLADGGIWLCVAGNADEVRDPEAEGPPQLKASELVDNVEGKFEIHQLGRATFLLPGGVPRLGWKAVFMKRPR
jgi:2-polyprenyl-3-methyl-5-hydroxy-6-metoxy-1,4-benzoquinol methylase